MTTSEFIIIGKEHCKYCLRAVELLEKLGLKFSYTDVTDLDYDEFIVMTDVAQKPLQTVPIIFFKDITQNPTPVLTYIGGYTKLAERFNGGLYDHLS